MDDLAPTPAPPAASDRRGVAELGRALAERTGCALDLVLNTNRHTLLSYKRLESARAGRPARLRVSIHHSFLLAPEGVLDAVALFLKGEETTPSRALLRRFLDAPEALSGGPRPEAGGTQVPPPPRRGAPGEAPPRWRSEAPAVPTAGARAVQLDLFGVPPSVESLAERAADYGAAPPPVPAVAPPPAWVPRLAREGRRSLDGDALPPAPSGLCPRGAHHDLRLIADTLNLAYFDGACPVHITWGSDGTPRGRRRRSILFGSYSAREHLVRVHPRLDASDIPRFFVEFIVYHEMLHKVVPPVMMPSGRRLVHSREFRRRERRFPRFRDALVFERRFVRQMM